MTDGGQFSAIVVPVDFAEAPEDESDVRGFIADAGTHRVAFSPATVAAVTLAAGVAASNEATLHLVHAVPPMQSSAIYQGPVSVPSKIIDEIHERAETTSTAAMTALVAEHVHVKDTSLPVQLHAAPGNALRYVLERARAVQADLIVMAASGRSRVARFFVGSTADRIIREALCPVLVVPAHRDE
ncbi:MAG: universal stress protein [Myxococcota bacterium]